MLGVWVHPDDPTGGHVFCGTHSGVYESKDFAETWTFRNDTTGWGSVMSFREGLIGGVKCVLWLSGLASARAAPHAIVLTPLPRYAVV